MFLFLNSKNVCTVNPKELSQLCKSPTNQKLQGVPINMGIY